MQKPQKLTAVLLQNGSIGDFLLFVWLAELLWASGQFSKILIILPRGADFLRGFLDAYPYLEVREVSRAHPLAAARLWLDTHAKRNTSPIVAVIHPSPGRIPLFVKLFAWALTRGPGSRLVGFQDAGPLCSRLYTTCLPYETNQLYSDTVRDIARAIGVVVPADTRPRLTFVTQKNALEALALQEKLYVVLHPTPSNRRRAPDLQTVVQIARCLAGQFPDATLVLSGGPQEKLFLEQAAATVRQSSMQTVVIAAGLPARDIASLLANARLYVGVDTGTSHLASLLSVPAVVLAHEGTAVNWLPLYSASTEVIYQLKGAHAAQQAKRNLQENAFASLRPFQAIEVGALHETLLRCIASRS